MACSKVFYKVYTSCNVGSSWTTIRVRSSFIDKLRKIHAVLSSIIPTLQGLSYGRLAEHILDMVLTCLQDDTCRQRFLYLPYRELVRETKNAAVLDEVTEQKREESKSRFNEVIKKLAEEEKTKSENRKSTRDTQDVEREPALKPVTSVQVDVNIEKLRKMGYEVEVIDSEEKLRELERTITREAKETKSTKTQNRREKEK